MIVTEMIVTEMIITERKVTEMIVTRPPSSEMRKQLWDDIISSQIVLLDMIEYNRVINIDYYIIIT